MSQNSTNLYDLDIWKPAIRRFDRIHEFLEPTLEDEFEFCCDSLKDKTFHVRESRFSSHLLGRLYLYSTVKFDQQRATVVSESPRWLSLATLFWVVFFLLLAVFGEASWLLPIIWIAGVVLFRPFNLRRRERLHQSRVESYKSWAESCDETAITV